MGVATAPLVSRAEELALLDGAQADLTRGEWKVVELVGEPGIGRPGYSSNSPLVPASANISCSQAPRPSSNATCRSVFVNALDDYLRGLDPRLLDLHGRRRPVPSWPTSSRHCPSSRTRTMPQQHERYLTHRAVRELLERLTATRPLVLILDDLHWADPASVELLRVALRRPPDAGVLIALAVRPEQLPARLKTELDHAHGTGTLAA